ncbi:Murein L,D-transpeptidase YcbB/YkuD [Roseibium suaedae]|uniref:Murein L,D-transpeptidase YcbB/YkuD n=2 Tax=Roseibium suaedae TaxID=735517 RepID=A0A1M7KYT3_9HYPH|nr:Murein L,D-transpeptidase YcbB/YkuD [Roseibium suaedae]
MARREMSRSGTPALEMRSKGKDAGTARRLVSLALAGLMTGTAAVTLVGVSAGEANAQNFFQRLFAPKENRVQQVQPRETQDLDRVVEETYVSAPRYYTYKADQLKMVSLAELSELKTAAVTPAVSEPASTDVADPAAAASPDGAQPVIEAPVVLTPFDHVRPVLKEMQVKALPEVGEALLAYYREHPGFLWIEDGRLSVKAGFARRVLASADEFGLEPADYLVQLPNLNGLEGDARDAALMDFEMHLTAAVLTYMLDAQRGRVDPDRLSGYHDLPRHKPDLVADLQSVASSADVTAALEAEQPQGSHFKALKEALAKLRAEDVAEDRIVIAPGTLLKPDNTSPEVKNVVAAIRKNGSPELLAEHQAVLDAYAGDELYSPELVALVKGYQKEKGLTPDGVVGKNSIKALVGVTNEEKISKLVLAMERSRWLPEQLGERKVFINQPAFTATYTEPGRDPLTMRVVVGKKSNQTNFFYDKIQVVEYNPYWGVPYSIIVNEMLPKLAKDPSYLDRTGYEVTTASGKPMSSASVNWAAVARKKTSVNVRQLPGSSNALGELKILFPNKHHIYMHDTPSKSLFNRDDRAYSHGCIRLQDPRAMAAAVLGKTKDYVGGRISQGQNQQEKVTGDIPVYISYFTAWPQEDGSIGYFSDVYDRDAYLIKAITATEAARG